MTQRVTTSGLSFFSLFAAPLAMGMGSPPPPPPPPAQTPISAPRSIEVGGFVNIKSNFDLRTLSLPKLTPSCLKKNNFEVIALDPGHDDSADSRRSDAKVRGGNGRFVFLWPKVHEGQLTMTTALLAYHYMVTNPALSPAERREMSRMVRLSRYPGERRFSEYEIAEGYSSSSPGIIDSGVSTVNGVSQRQARVNQMLRQHRAYSSSASKGWSSSTKNVQEKAIFLSIHANSTDYFDEGDHGWMIPPNSTSIATLTSAYQSALATGFGIEMFSEMKPRSSDEGKIFDLKNALYRTFEKSQIRVGKRSGSLAMLSTNLGTSRTLKVLAEGFVMNGKAGHIAHLELNSSSPKQLVAYREGQEVMQYGYSTVYDAYARSVVSGFASLLKCD